MSENMQTSIPSGADTINTDQIKKSSARTCSVISFYKNAYTALAVTALGLLFHCGLLNISDGTLVFICILSLISLGVGLVGVVTMGYRIGRTERLTRKVLVAACHREDKAVLLLLEDLENHKNIPYSAFWRMEPFVLKEISL